MAFSCSSTGGKGRECADAWLWLPAPAAAASCLPQCWVLTGKAPTPARNRQNQRAPNPRDRPAPPRPPPKVVKRLNAAAARHEAVDAVGEFGAACAANEDRAGGGARNRVEQLRTAWPDPDSTGPYLTIWKHCPAAWAAPQPTKPPAAAPGPPPTNAPAPQPPKTRPRSLWVHDPNVLRVGAAGGHPRARAGQGAVAGGRRLYERAGAGSSPAGRSARLFLQLPFCSLRFAASFSRPPAPCRFPASRTAPPRWGHAGGFAPPTSLPPSNLLPARLWPSHPPPPGRARPPVQAVCAPHPRDHQQAPRGGAARRRPGPAARRPGLI